jgi:hypothetical protein
MQSPTFLDDFEIRARSLFHWAEVIYSHLPLRSYAPPGTFCFTVLRHPIDRIVSQVADWRRLNIDDYPWMPEAVALGMRDLQRLNLRDFLEEHATTTFSMLFDNYLTRALAGARLGPAVTEYRDLRYLALTAQESINADFDLVGISELSEQTRVLISQQLGLPPPT